MGRRSTGLAAGPRGAACALSLGKRRAARPLHPNSPTAALPGRRKGRRRPGWPVVRLELARARVCVCACARTLARKGCPVFTRGRVGGSNPEPAVLRGNDWLASPATAHPPPPLRPIPLPPLPRHGAPCPGLAFKRRGARSCGLGYDIGPVLLEEPRDPCGPATPTSIRLAPPSRTTDTW